MSSTTAVRPGLVFTSRLVFVTASAILLVSERAHAQSPNCAFLSAERTVLQNGGTSAGTIGTNDPGGLTKLGRDVFLSDDTEVIGDRIKVGNAASLDDVRGNQVKLGKKATVRGTTSGVTLPVVEPFCPIGDFDCGGGDVTVGRGETRILPPGSYDSIELASGARLELSPGSYTVCDVSAGKNTTIIASGGSTMLQIVGALQVGNGGSLVSNAGDPPLIVDVAGTERVKLGRNVVVAAFLSAPNARVSVGNGGELIGSMCAERLDLGKNSALSCSDVPTTTTSTAPVTTTSTSTTSSSITNTTFLFTTTSITTSSTTSTSTTNTSSSTVLASTTSTSTSTSSTSSTAATGCGNGMIDGDEACDQDDFGDTTCASSPGAGSPGGALLCNVDCTIDFTNCMLPTTSTSVPETTTSTLLPTTTSTTVLETTTSTVLVTTTSTSSSTTTTLSLCGNGVIDGDEECDENDFGDTTCPSSPSGALLCNGDCTIDFSGCGSSTSTTLQASTTSTLVTTSTIAPASTTSSTLAPVTTSSTVPVTTSSTLVTTTSTTSSTTTSIPVTCGNGTLDAGEECDTTDFGNTSCTSPGGAFPEPGSPSGALLCNSNCTTDYTNCQFPTTTSTAPGETTTTSTAPAGTTTTTLPALGTRTFTLANVAAADDPAGSHFYTSAIGSDVSSRNFVGSIALAAGTPNASGIATLTIASNTTIGFGVIDGSIVCAQVVAAGSTGKLDCDGGLAVGMSSSQDSNGIAAPGPFMLETEQGAAGPAGSGYVVSTVRILNCGTDQNQPAAPGCSSAGGRVLAVADCADATKANYAAGASETLGMTTGTHTAEVTDRRPGSLGGGTIARTGTPFDCDAWETDGPGIVEIGVVAMDNGQAGDIANIVQLDD